MNASKLDHIDKEILNLLQKQARMPLKEIAEKVFLSSPAVSARIDRLMKEGYIDSFQAHLNPIALGYHIKAFINLEVEPIQKKEFYPFIESIPNVIECNCVTGNYAMLISVLFKSTADLDIFINQLQRFGKTKTQIVFSTSVKHRGVVIDE
ncbi:Lrp/AsnC family transcriptional regulator [Candidatus Galacturonibacter soehngenii]|uniref:Lrp/AsnC family transcriptional regulator n=1 Tax=Candidatus Galacturonatibacter soehngenii TaxID=2307010 RepID=A0A7V7QIX6_9FIRM|nr:Lrp/AsnC family transcriptional regulator [Candidatus Galacturonibacter soehngenii]KAB1437462.1 Lrp/AsnC family transcriptional regulator [Candidatus Galacturonibacter soehngenii]MBA4688666.1 Lrp/AsnC family transcriptional regulator [Candidatus Galacturonibacter soehngenii]